MFLSVLQHNARGILAMANSGPNTNGSQFFITYAKQPHLNGLYTVFGRVIHGFEVLDIMEKVFILHLRAVSVLLNIRCFSQRRYRSVSLILKISYQGPV